MEARWCESLQTWKKGKKGFSVGTLERGKQTIYWKLDFLLKLIHYDYTTQRATGLPANTLKVRSMTFNAVFITSLQVSTIVYNSQTSPTVCLTKHKCTSGTRLDVDVSKMPWWGRQGSKSYEEEIFVSISWQHPPPPPPPHPTPSLFFAFSHSEEHPASCRSRKSWIIEADKISHTRTASHTQIVRVSMFSGGGRGIG